MTPTLVLAGPPAMLEIETPALLLYHDVMERNLKHMADRAKQLGVALRPHIKTHKCLKLGRRQQSYGAAGITVSTLFEAQAFVAGGFTDLTWAFPLDPTHIPHVRHIARDGVTLRVIVDDLDTAKALAGSGLHVWLKVDCGYHRAGVDPSSRYALDVARELGAERGLSFDGILSHSGHAYRAQTKSDAAHVAEQERQVMVWFAELLRKDGLPVRGVSVGSTPAMAAAQDLTGVTEARPGNYIFYDRTMVLIGCCEPRDVAVSVLATVVSHQPGASHFVVDAGALSLSKDLGPTHLGLEPAFGAVTDHPELTVASVSQEHGVIRAAAPEAIEGNFKVGQQVQIMPNHSCLTEAHFDEYVVVEGGRVMDRWHIERGR
jgi:threo-3-hydroxy-D-aspartate ammonia-lyase